MRAIVLVDLDDTLFQTLRKCPPDVPEDALTALGFGRDGGAARLRDAAPGGASWPGWARPLWSCQSPGAAMTR